jgi:hypothetical protein
MSSGRAVQYSYPEEQLLLEVTLTNLTVAGTTALRPPTITHDSQFFYAAAPG